MKERGPSPVPNNRKPEVSPNLSSNEKPTSPKKLEQQTMIPQPTKINISGYSFTSLENIRNFNNPREMKHYYEMKEKDSKKLEVTVIEYGLNDPKRDDEPILLRMDYGCPCMEMPLASHDCKAQRDIAMDAIQKTGRGMLVLVNTEASAAMGHGTLRVWQQQRWLQDALHSGDDSPSVKDFYDNGGFKNFDIRNHHEVAALISRRLQAASYDSDKTPLILLGSSPEKIKSLENGHNIPVADTARVIDVRRTDTSKDYHNGSKVPQSGVYLEEKTSDGETKLILLTHIFPKYKELIFEPRKRQEKQQKQKKTKETDEKSINNNKPTEQTVYTMQGAIAA